MASFVTQIVSAFTSLIAGLGSGIVSMFDTLILDSQGQLTTFATWIAVFIGLSVAFYLLRAVLRRV